MGDLEKSGDAREHDSDVTDQRLAFDTLRKRCPVAREEQGGWSLYRHADIRRVLHDHKTFSNSVSRHLSVPNGMDPPGHADYRRIIEPYFSAARMAAFEPRCRSIASGLAADTAAAGTVDFMQALAGPFAGRVQCAFLGWPESLHGFLREWARRNQEATRRVDRGARAALAREFEDRIRSLLDERRAAGAGPDADLTAALMHERVHGRFLNEDEIVSILRNWTVGEVGTIATAVGILAHHLAADSALQERLRTDSALIPTAADEILRLDGPLAANRRRTTCPVEIGGQRIESGEQLTLVWISANRDPAAFEEPDEVRLDRGTDGSLLYGEGIHVCPGAPLARLELRVVLEELLHATTAIEPDAADPVRARWPAAGFQQLPLRFVAARARRRGPGLPAR